MPGADTLGEPDSSGDVARGMPDLMEGVARLTSSASAGWPDARVGQSDAGRQGKARSDGSRVFSGVQLKAGSVVCRACSGQKVPVKDLEVLYA